MIAQEWPSRRGKGPGIRGAALLVALAGALALTVAGCSTVSQVNPFHGKEKPKEKIKGTRIPVIELNDQLKVSDALKGQDFDLPPPDPVTQWPLPGGAPSQAMGHVEAGQAFVVAWKRSIGTPSGKGRHVTAPPVAADGRIYAMDGGAEVSAWDQRTGARIWRTSLVPKSRRLVTAWGGGLAAADGKLYVTSGYREVAQLDAATGRIGWRTRTESPIHAAPTVYGGRLFVADVNDEMLAIDTATGAQAWTYQALTEPATILAASSPAVDAETVVAGFASGELVAMRAANGNELWNASLSRVSRSNALSEIRAIAGRPAIYRGDVYAVSHSDVFAAVDLRTGVARWTLPISAITSPWPAGDVVYVVDLAGEVICASRDSGQVYWIRNLNQGLKKKAWLLWSSPILASNRLIVVSSKGEALALNPKTGATLGKLRVGSDTFLAPIAAGGMLYVVTETAQLVAIR